MTAALRFDVITLPFTPHSAVMPLRRRDESLRDAAAYATLLMPPLLCFRYYYLLIISPRAACCCFTLRHVAQSVKAVLAAMSL